MPPSFLRRVARLRAPRWLALAAAAIPVVAEGQTRVRVSVSDHATGRPIGGAQVALRLARVGGLSDSEGAILLEVPRPGGDTVVVRFAGYADAVLPVELRPDETTELGVRLRQGAITLPTVTVAETRIPREPGLGFARRQKMGLGHFVIRTDIERFAPTNSSDILRRVPGVRVGSNRAGDHVITMARSATRCRVQYYVDNMPMPTDELLDAAIEQRIIADLAQNGSSAASRAKARSKKLNRDLPAFTIDHIPPEMIEAIEVYRGAAEIPIEYRTAGSVCGVVLIWTKTGT
jgi:hypothetical protein